MSAASSARGASWDIRLALWVIAVVALLFLLRAASTLFIPIVIAAVISYALAPVVTWLEQHRIPAIAGAALVLFAIVGAAASGAYAVRHDARMLVESVPETMQRWRDQVMEQIGPATRAIERASPEPKPGSNAGSGAETQISGTATQLTGSFVQRLVGTTFGFIGHLVVVFFLVYFLLISGHHIRDRLVEISGPDPDRRRVTATIVNDINAQIQRYLLVLLVTGVIVGVATWLLLRSLGVQHAAIWGLLAGIFNSIPYFGPVLVSGGLLLVGLMQDGPAQALKMSGAAIVLTSLEGWLLTPALMGKAERMNPLAVFLGLLVWTWVWGAWGTVLAVPMLVVLKSVADHIERLRPLGRLMAP